MKDSLLSTNGTNMPIIRIAPVCNGKIYVVPRPTSDEEHICFDLPIEERVEHVSTNSDKVIRKLKEKYQLHIQSSTSPRFSVKHRSASSDNGTVYLYILPLQEEHEISFRKGKFVTSEDIAAHPEMYGPNLQMESELLGMAAELWNNYYL